MPAVPFGVQVADLPFIIVKPSGDATYVTDTANIQAALDAAAGRPVFLMPSKYYVNALTVPEWGELAAFGYQPRIGGTGKHAELQFNLASGVGITLAGGAKLSGMILTNVGSTYNETTKQLSASTAAAVLLTNSVLIEECTFATWYKCIVLGAESYYAKTVRVMFNRCAIGYYSDIATAYNLDINQPASAFTNTFFLGTAGTRARNIKVFGGSIEGYETVAKFFQEISFFGTYFETITERTGYTVYALDPGGNAGSVTVHGCLVYMNFTHRFVNMSSYTDCMLDARGNTFAGTGLSTSRIYQLPSTGTVSLGADKFGPNLDNGCLYVSSITDASKFDVYMPLLPSGNTQAGYSGARLTGPNGIVMIGLTAAPASPIVGMLVQAHGTSWDPLSRAAGRPYWVTWQGDRWRTPGGLT